MRLFRMQKDTYIKWCQENLDYEFDYDRAHYLVDKPERKTPYAAKFHLYSPITISFDEPNYIALPWYMHPDKFCECLFIINHEGRITFYDGEEGYNEFPIKVLVPAGDYQEGDHIGWFYSIETKFDETSVYQKEIGESTAASLSFLYGKDIDIRKR